MLTKVCHVDGSRKKMARQRVLSIFTESLKEIGFSRLYELLPSRLSEKPLQLRNTLRPSVSEDFPEDRIVRHSKLTPFIAIRLVDDLKIAIFVVRK